MEATSVLLILAEVSVGLCGFAGIVVALRQRPGKWQRDERLRFIQLLFFGLGCTFFSVIPLGLLLGPIEPAAVVTLSGVPASILFASIATTSTYRIVRLDNVARSNLNVPLTCFVIGGTFLVSIVGFCNAVGVGFDRTMWIYVMVLVWALLVCGLQFIRIIIVGLDAR